MFVFDKRAPITSHSHYVNGPMHFLVMAFMRTGTPIADHLLTPNSGWDRNGKL
jgi:hypothetical protein